MKLINQALLMVVALLFLGGCGSDSSDSVFTTTSTTPTTGSVTFNFVRAQTALTVPTDTQQIRFDFFDGTNGTGSNVLTTTRPFAPQITITSVPVIARSVVVTALDGNDQGLLVVVVPEITVVPGGNIVVDFTGLNPDVPDPDPTPDPTPLPVVQLGAPQVLSNNLNANKTKLISLQINNVGVFETVLVAVYGDDAGADVWDAKGNTFAAQDIYARRSTDGGATWSAPVNLSNTAALSSFSADHDGDSNTAPIPYAGHSEKPNVFGNGKNVVVTWVDAYAPGGNQSSVLYPEIGNVEVPFHATYAVRSNDGGLTWSSAEALGDGSRDAKQDVNRGNSNAWCVMWQEDPHGLQPGDAEGPGEGGSGANVSKGTDIWYTSLSNTDFSNGTAFPAPVRLTNNFTKTDMDGREDGKEGASRANIALVGGTAVVAYEESKGLEGLDVGKYIRYHVFPALNPAADPTSKVGTIISTAEDSGRRVRILTQGTPGTDTGLKLCIFWREGEFDEGGPADVVCRMGHVDPNNGASTGLRPEDMTPPVAAGATDRANALNNTPPLNLSSDLGLNAGTSDNPFEDALAHRGALRGDSILLGYSRTPDWAKAKYTTLENYNFFIRRSLDGGATWSEPRNMTNITDTTITVKEPRIVGTPMSSDPNAPQNPDVVYVAWGTETNVYDHLGESPTQLDIYLTYTTDFGATYGGVTTLAGGPAGQFECQLRTSPDGRTLWAVWNETLNGITNAVFRSGTLP